MSSSFFFLLSFHFQARRTANRAFAKFAFSSCFGLCPSHNRLLLPVLCFVLSLFSILFCSITLFLIWELWDAWGVLCMLFRRGEVGECWGIPENTSSQTAKRAFVLSFSYRSFTFKIFSYLSNVLLWKHKHNIFFFSIVIPYIFN